MLKVYEALSLSSIKKRSKLSFSAVVQSGLSFSAQSACSFCQPAVGQSGDSTPLNSTTASHTCHSLFSMQQANPPPSPNSTLSPINPLPSPNSPLSPINPPPPLTRYLLFRHWLRLYALSISHLTGLLVNILVIENSEYAVYLHEQTGLLREGRGESEL